MDRVSEQELAALRQGRGTEIKIIGKDLSGVDLFGASLREVDFTGVDLSDADLRRVDLTRACLRGAHLRRTDLRGVTAAGADFVNTYVAEADLRDGDFSYADFRGSTGRCLAAGAIFRGIQRDSWTEGSEESGQGHDDDERDAIRAERPPSDRPEWLDEIDACYARQDAEALAELREKFEDHGNDEAVARCYYLIGVVARQVRGRAHGAVYWYRVINDYPDSAVANDAAIELGHTLKEDGELVKALQMYERGGYPHTKRLREHIRSKGLGRRGAALLIL